MAIVGLVLLALVPFGAWRYAHAHNPTHMWCIVGLSFGAVVSPLSTGLYASFFLGPFGLPTGVLGLALSLFHGPPGFHAAHWFGLVPYDVVSGISHLYIELLNGVFWGITYGVVGAAVDWLRLRVQRGKIAP